MAVTSVKEIHNGRDGGTRLSKDGRTIRTYTRAFRVTTDSNYTEAATIKAAVPRVGAVYPNDTAAYCTDVVVRNEDFARRVWIVSCSYSTEKEIQENPLAEPAEIEWDTEAYQRPFYKDRDEKVIANKAGEPLIDPPIMGDASRLTVTVRKNVASVPAWILQYRDAVNADQFTLGGLAIPVGKAKLMRFSIGARQERNDVYYYVFSYSLALSDTGWGVEYPNVGFKEVDPNDATKRIDILVNGEPAPQPWPLDNSGAAIENPTENSLITLTANIYPEKTFGGVLPTV